MKVKADTGAVSPHKNKALGHVLECEESMALLLSKNGIFHEWIYQ